MNLLLCHAWSQACACVALAAASQEDRTIRKIIMALALASAAMIGHFKAR
jgi:hypothetical protein